MLIREIRTDDAENFINLVKRVEEKSNFMLMDPGERRTTLEQQRTHIKSLKQQKNSTILVAEENDKLTGYLIIIGGRANRIKHSAYIVIGVAEDCRGQGIGTALFSYAEEWATIHHISRLELTVVTENEAGIALYKKGGFDIEGTKRNSLQINGTFFNEYYMSKLL